MAPKSRVVYILLAVLLGTLGIHNFYAGYTRNAIIQLAITVISAGMLSIISWIWAVIEAVKVEKDAAGVPFAS